MCSIDANDFILLFLLKKKKVCLPKLVSPEPSSALEALIRAPLLSSLSPALPGSANSSPAWQWPFAGFSGPVTPIPLWNNPM